MERNEGSAGLPRGARKNLSAAFSLRAPTAQHVGGAFPPCPASKTEPRRACARALAAAAPGQSERAHRCRKPTRATCAARGVAHFPRAAAAAADTPVALAAMKKKRKPFDSAPRRRRRMRL